MYVWRKYAQRAFAYTAHSAGFCFIHFCFTRFSSHFTICKARTMAAKSSSELMQNRIATKRRRTKRNKKKIQFSVRCSRARAHVLCVWLNSGAIITIVIAAIHNSIVVVAVYVSFSFFFFYSIIHSIHALVSSSSSSSVVEFEFIAICMYNLQRVARNLANGKNWTERRWNCNYGKLQTNRYTQMPAAACCFSCTQTKSMLKMHVKKKLRLPRQQ